MYRHQIASLGYYDQYLSLVPEQDVHTALSASAEQLAALDTAQLLQLEDRVYAPGKWTIRDIFQHITDCERIMSYRALRFARQDRTSLPSFDENAFAAAAATGRRPLVDILAELAAVRSASRHLYYGFDEEMLLASGHCFGQELSVLGLGYVIAGHQRHHLDIIRERYLPLRTR